MSTGPEASERPGRVSRPPKFPRPLKCVCSEGTAELASFTQTFRGLLCRTHSPFRKRQAVSASFEQASFQLLSRVQAVRDAAAHNKPYPQAKNPSPAGPRQQKGAPGFRAGGSLGSTSAMRQQSSRLPCSKPCQHRGACRPLRQLLLPHSSWLARSGRSPSPQEEKRHAST